MSSALASLLKRSTIEDHNEVLKAANSVLKTAKQDIQAQHVKLVALVKLERYGEAVHFGTECGQSLQESANLAYAYALYKTGDWDKAAEIALQTQDERGLNLLAAQALYRAERFPEALRAYKAAVGSPARGEEFDLRVNDSAINAQLHWAGVDGAETKKPGRQDLESFETAYNAACGSIARDELGQAEVLLKRAKQLCEHSEDLAPEQKLEELIPISVQQLYVLERLGKADEAKALVAEISPDKIPDVSSRKISQSNVLAVSAPFVNPFQAHKIYHTNSDIPPSDKPFTFQRRLMLENDACLDLQTFKYDGVAASSLRQIQAENQPSLSAENLTSSTIYAAAVAKSDLPPAALKLILPEITKHPQNIGLLLTAVQIYVSSGNVAAATQAMEAFFQRLSDLDDERTEAARYNPALVSILISLYQKQGRRSHIKQELAKAATYWRHRSKPPSTLLHSAGVSLLESNESNDRTAAQEIFAILHKHDITDKAAVAGYIASHQGDVTHDEISNLTSVEDLVKGIDVDALEKAGIPQSSSALAIAQGQTRKRAAPSSAATRPKRIRTSRLPKEYDADKKPDPERWLPLRDRSTYRPKGRKKGKKAGDDRTQGGVVADDVGINGSAASKPASTVIGAGGNKKRKGKGKK